MKYRLAILTTMLVLGLVSCSLAEDVTPPPDYVAPTALPSNTPAPVATLTPVPPSPTADVVDPVTTTETAPAETSPEISPTPGIQTGIVNGMVVNGSGGSIPADLNITLRGFDMPTDPNGSPNEAINQTTSLKANGLYEFTNVEMPAGRIFLAQVEYNGVPYQSDYLVTEQGLLTLPDLTIFDTTSDYKLLTLTQVHIALDYSTPETVQVIVMYVISNTSGKTVTVSTDGTSIPFVQIPEGAANVNFQVANGSASFIGTEAGFALVPNQDEGQYGLVNSFSIPYTRKITLAQQFLLPAVSVKIFAPEGVKLTGSQLTDQGVQDFNGTSYHLYETNDVAADTTLTIKISGKPVTAADTASGGVTRNQWLIIGLGALGMALIGIGLFFFIRDRRRSQSEDEEDEEEMEDEIEEEDGEETETEEPADALGDDRDAILDAILALDDQFKAGEISREVYETRREELKERLKKSS